MIGNVLSLKESPPPWRKIVSSLLYQCGIRYSDIWRFLSLSPLIFRLSRNPCRSYRWILMIQNNGFCLLITKATHVGPASLTVWCCRMWNYNKQALGSINTSLKLPNDSKLKEITRSVHNGDWMIICFFCFNNCSVST